MIGPAILKGEFEKTPPIEADAEDWSLAKEWHAALIEHGAQMPSSIQGMKGLQTLSMLGELLCPVRRNCPFRLKRHKPEDLPKMMTAAEGELLGYLKGLGY